MLFLLCWEVVLSADEGMPPPRHLHVASLAPCAITPTLGDRAHRGALIQGFLGYPALQCQRCLGSGRERRLLHTPTYTGKAR